MDYSAANQSLWNFIIQLGFIAGTLLAAFFLRNAWKAIQKTMLPVSVMAGFMLLFLKYLGLPVDDDAMGVLVYHGIAMGFIAMSLRIPAGEKADAGHTGLRSGAVIVGSYLVQGITGLLISLLLSMTVMPGLFQAAGMLLPMGYGQGPGQANNVGSTYEAMGFVGGRSFGMSIAAAGYLVACTVGVIILNVRKRKGNMTMPPAAKTERERDYFDSEQSNPMSASIDILSIQIGLVMLVYLLTYLFTWGVTSLIGLAAPGASATVSPLLWGFNFIIGSALAMLVRFLLSKSGTKRTSGYQNNYLLNRISGFCFDIMIVAGIASINIEDIRQLWLPFMLMTVLGGIITWVHLRIVCKKVYAPYYDQGLISMFGMMTGTISSGVLLLREIDPELSTPAASNLVTGSSFGIVLGAPLLILVSMASRGQTMCFVTLGLMVVYLAFMYFIIYVADTKRKRERK